MGVVYKARQVRLNRIVALKTIRGIADGDSELASRFRIEAEASERLRRVLTPESPVFMDLLAYGVSIITLVVLSLWIVWGT